jgi:serine/threonine-protein kinase
VSEFGTDLQPGAKVGEYVVDRKLAEGGMGAVYAGHHPVIGKKVAVKVLAPQCAAVPDLVRRFAEEARAVNKIGHPNIVDIFSFGTLADARPYFVMEFLEGASLGQRLEAGDLKPDETRRILRQICSALEAAHRAGIVHRDLKPENVWIASPAHEDSYAKVLDFGIAKLLDNPQGQRTQTGAAMGTPRYMAPEQCMGKDVGPRADLYSLGVILYEMYAGVPPFRGDTFGELLYQHMSMAPEAPSKHRPIDPALEQVILACLEKDPQRRPESAKDLSARLDQALGGGRATGVGVSAIQPAATAPVPSVAVPVASASGTVPVTTMGQSVGELSLPPRPRRGAPMLVVGGVALAVVVGGALLLHARSRSAVSTVASPAPPPREPVVTPPPAQPPAPATGRLRLHIDNGPSDRIVVDGKVVGYGMSDVEVGDLAPGSHQVRLEGAYRPPQAAAFTVAAGAAASLTLSLPPTVPAGGAPHRARPTVSAEDEQTHPPAVAKPKPKPSRAEEHGLMDSNPFRNP